MRTMPRHFPSSPRPLEWRLRLSAESKRPGAVAIVRSLLTRCLLTSCLLASLLLASPVSGQQPAAPAEAEPVAEGLASASGSAPSPATRAKNPEDKKNKPGRKGKKEKRLKRAEIDKRLAELPEKYRTWASEVEVLISDGELAVFVEIEQDYQRDAFIERFWRTRDPYPDSPRNEMREHWNERLQYARELFGNIHTERARYLLLNGPPTARIDFTCSTVTVPLDIWFYQRSDRVGYEFFLVFARKFGRREYSLWRPSDPADHLFDFGSQGKTLQMVLEEIYTCREGKLVASVLLNMMRAPMEHEMLLAKIERPAENPSPEWVATFNAYSTDLPEDSEQLEATVDVTFPARYKTRTVTAVAVEVATANAATSDLGGNKAYNFFLTGEVLREGQLFESFRYRYDFPAATLGEGDPLPILFERRLRPGDYRLVIKLEDLNSKRAFRVDREIEVPIIETTLREAADPETRRVLDQAAAAIGSDTVTIQIVPPRGEMQLGFVRFDTLTTGEIAELRFALDGSVVMQKRRPPFSVELDLGRVPRTHLLRVSAHDEEGREVASDELVLNAARNTFDVRFLEPRPGGQYTGSVDAEVDVDLPEGAVVERVELYLDETLLATLYQPPFKQRVPLPEGNELAYVRAVAYQPDGLSTEDLVYINAPDYLEVLDIQYVELYTSVLDRDGRPVEDLTASDFTILEDEVPQTILRFEQVDNLPVHAQVMIDVSASMEEDLEETRRAALEFFETTMTPKDRAALITFNDHPYLAVDFTNDPKALAGGLAGLKAERGTSLFDAVVFGLYYLNGIKGQRAILLLSDGKDETSRFDFEDTLEYSRRAGVAIYAIGLDIRGKSSGVAKKQLSRLSDETGGRAFFIRTSAELAEVYRQIQRELRSRYLITYQSTNDRSDDGFRTVELEALRSGVEVKTIRGYYP